ncbi:hypothetical protein ACP3WA_26975, partial [Salmonella enterica]|uniref:hypothetical protein n=1 Tax=Salmonella enterica TaxID=28901 RepID=UPI003CEAAF4D
KCLINGDISGSPNGIIERATAQSSSPWLDDLANEVDATLNWLQNGFLRIETSGQLVNEKRLDL